MKIACCTGVEGKISEHLHKNGARHALIWKKMLPKMAWIAFVEVTFLSWGRIRGKILRTPKNLPAPTPMACCSKYYVVLRLDCNKAVLCCCCCWQWFVYKIISGHQWPLLKAGLWSRYSNFRLRLQLRASKFFGSGSRTIWSKKQKKHGIICIIRLNRNPNFRLRLHHLKNFWLRH